MTTINKDFIDPHDEDAMKNRIKAFAQIRASFSSLRDQVQAQSTELERIELMLTIFVVRLTDQPPRLRNDDEAPQHYRAYLLETIKNALYNDNSSDALTEEISHD